MTYPTIEAALAAYKHTIFKQWLYMTYFLGALFFMAISCIHGMQIREYCRLTTASKAVTQRLLELKKDVASRALLSRRLKLLTALSPYFLPPTGYATLLSIAKTIPPRTFITSLTLTSKHSLLLTGFSHSKKELGIFKKELTRQQLFPCRVRKIDSRGPIGVFFILSLSPKKDTSAFKSALKPLVRPLYLFHATALTLS